MATSLTLTTGPISTTLTAQDEETARTILLMFAHATGAPVGASNQAKLDHVAAELGEYMRKIARERWKDENGATLEAAANTAVHW